MYVVIEQTFLNLVSGQAFMREIALWGQLDHPNILPFYGVYYLDNAEERICLFSPWMENGTLSEYLRSFPDAYKLLLVGLQESIHKAIFVLTR